MRPFTLLAAGSALLAAALGPANAADQNGYTATYECRAGNPVCNVDVEALSRRACDQVITPQTAPTHDWSAIDWSNDTICIGAGDHAARGTLYLQASGSAQAPKVLRYQGPSNDDPWHQSNRARILALHFNGQDYWVVNRITVDTGNGAPPGSEAAVFLSADSDNNILDHVLVQNARASLIGGEWRSATYNNVVQNSVVRRTVPIYEGEPNCFDPYKGRYWYIVNNEAYDCHKVFSIGAGVDDNRGMVLENNDFYVSSERYTDCSGHYNGVGPCSTSEAIMSIKSGGKPDALVRHIHNRIWGGRTGDGVLIGGSNTCNGSAITLSRGEQLHQSASWLLFQNNIVMESQQGIGGYWGPDQNDSVIGNLVYDIRRFNTGCNATYGIWLSSKQYGEWYLNTVIDTEKWLTISGSDTSGGPDLNNDMRCNVVISGGAREGGAGSGTVVDHNTFYGTTPYSAGGNNNLSFAVKRRAGSSNYNVGDILIVDDSWACTGADSPACYMYRVIAAGTTSAGAADYCTTLGCTMADGSVSLQAIRGPYSFYRKLQTGPEQAVIPYARIHTSAPEARQCPADFASRPGVGVSNDG